MEPVSSMPNPNRLKVYIAGPYTRPDPCANTNAACKVWDQLWEAGYAPFCPHWSHFQHTMMPRPYADWLAYDIEWLKACDVLLRLPGESSGADKEVEFANAHGITVVHSIADLDCYRRSQTDE